MRAVVLVLVALLGVASAIPGIDGVSHSLQRYRACISKTFDDLS